MGGSKRPVVVLLAACIAGSGTYAALASPQFQATAQVTYLSPRPGASTGLAVLLTWTDPGAPAGAPKVIKQIRLRFPGARFDTSALPRCRASDKEVKSLGTAACPRKTVLATGSTNAVTPSGAKLTTHVTLFNARNQIIVLVRLGRTPLIEFRDRVQRDTITVRPPLPAGVALTRLALTIPAHATAQAGRRRVYARTPPSCPVTGSWTIMTTFTYADGSTEELTSTTSCQAGGR